MRRARIVRMEGHAERTKRVRFSTRIVRAAEMGARLEAEAILKDAEARRSQILDQANRQARAILDEADSTVAQAIVREVASVSQQLRQLLIASKADVEQLAIRVAEKIVRREVSRDPSVVEGVVSRMLDEAVNQRVLEIRVHPDDLLSLTQMQAAQEPAVAFVADDTISPGGCVVRTAVGEIDGRVETRLDAIRKVLFAEPE